MRLDLADSTGATASLPGQATLVECWRALAQLSPGARVVHAPGSRGSCVPFMGAAEQRHRPRRGERAVGSAATEMTSRYHEAGIERVGVVGAEPRGRPGRARRGICGRLTGSGTPRRSSCTPPCPRLCDLTTASSRPRSPPSNGSPPTSPFQLTISACRTNSPDSPHGSWCRTVSRWRRRGRSSMGATAGSTRSRRCPGGGDGGSREPSSSTCSTTLREQGARTASLQSTPMGQHLYEVLGFEAAGRYEEWVAR